MNVCLVGKAALDRWCAMPVCMWGATVLQWPYQARQLCLCPIFAVLDGGLVLGITCLEWIFSHPNVVLDFVLVLNSGFIYYIGLFTYEPVPSVVQPKRKRRRRIIWFNPPYSKSTNIGKEFSSFWIYTSPNNTHFTAYPTIHGKTVLFVYAQYGRHH